MKAHAINMELETPDGTLRGQVAVPVGTMRLAELAFNAMALDQRLVRFAEDREEAAGNSISCCAGCGACCRQLVPLSAPEAWMIADIVGGMPEARRQEVFDRFRGAAKIIYEKGLGARVMEAPDSAESARALSRDYFSLGVACPFLENESCSIHEARPSICREYLVTSPAENCKDPFTGPIHRIKVNVRLSKALAKLTAELTGRTEELIPLTLALGWAAANQEDAQKEWDGKEMLERLLELMSQG